MIFDTVLELRPNMLYKWLLFIQMPGLEGDPTSPGNYRGITVAPVLLKVLEHVLNTRHNKILEETQSKLQKGFTSGCPSLNAAVFLTECILESKTISKTFY